MTMSYKVSQSKAKQHCITISSIVLEVKVLVHVESYRYLTCLIIDECVLRFEAV